MRHALVRPCRAQTFFGRHVTQGGDLGGLTLGYIIAAPSGRRRESGEGQKRRSEAIGRRFLLCGSAPLRLCVKRTEKRLSPLLPLLLRSETGPTRPFSESCIFYCTIANTANAVRAAALHNCSRLIRLQLQCCGCLSKVSIDS